MKNIDSRTENLTNESLKAIKILTSVIGLSGCGDIKGTVGVGKSSICNRLVRPNHFNQKQVSTLSKVDFDSDIINGTNSIYWNHIIETVYSKAYAFHFIEQTVLINDQNFLPFLKETEANYINRVTSNKIIGSKRAYISPSQFSQSQEDNPGTLTDHKSNVDAFIVVFDVSEVNHRDYQAQDRIFLKLLTTLQKLKKPVIIALSKTDIKSTKIKARFDLIVEKHNFKYIPVVETSAKLNINISVIPSIIISEIQGHNRPLTLKGIIKRSCKINTFEEEYSRLKQLKENFLNRFRYMVNIEVTKVYDLSWQDFASSCDLSFLSGLIDKNELISEFKNCKASLIKTINESLMLSYLVLFKKILFEFIPSIMIEEQSINEKVIQSLLQNKLFQQHFQDKEINENKIFSIAHLSNTVDYPLPRFLISKSNPSNKLHLIESCIKEINLQRTEKKFCNEFLKTLESEQELYEDMFFDDVEDKFKDCEMWNHYKDLAKSIFLEFVEDCINKFKVLFNEKLLELSLMIFMYVPVKSCMRKCNIKEKEYMEILPDMDMMKNINNKIYFDNPRFNKSIYQDQRIKWVVKYIGSLISSNPYQCYHFDFNYEQCQRNLQKYLKPVKKYVQSIVIIISCDYFVDEFWKSTIFDKTIEIDSRFSSSFEFIPSDELTEEKLWSRQFSCCQKFIILMKEVNNDGSDIVKKLLHKYLNYPDQISIINVEFYKTIPTNMPLNLATSNSSELECHIANPELISHIKDRTISYISQSEPVCIWMIVLCDDKYDSCIPISFFLSLFDDYIILQHQYDENTSSMSMVYVTFGSVIPQRLILTVFPYHQAFKLLNDECQSLTLHLLMYFCDINRLASINTTFAVVQNIQTIFPVKSVICAIKFSNLLDEEDFINRKKMINGLGLENCAQSIILDLKDGTENGLQADAEDTFQLMSLITDCTRLANFMEHSKDLCRYNIAYQNEDQLMGSSKMENICCNSDLCGGNSEKDCPNDNILQHSSFESRDRTFSNSDSLVSPDTNFSDQFFAIDQGKLSSLFIDVEYCASVPLGCFNEHLFRPILEESNFYDEIQDTSTVVLINCNNSEHRESSNEVNATVNQQSCKFRSFSGPIHENKSSARKYSTVQNPFNRSQRYSTQKSHSLTTSPVTVSIKSYSQPQIDTLDTPQTRPIAASKSIKNVFSRFFSSDRSNNKSAEEKRSIFRRSLKFTKKNSDKKIKTIPTSTSSSEGLFHRSTHSSSSFILPSPHSTPLTVLDTKGRTKSATKPVFSL